MWMSKLMHILAHRSFSRLLAVRVANRWSKAKSHIHQECDALGLYAGHVDEILLVLPMLKCWLCISIWFTSNFIVTDMGALN